MSNIVRRVAGSPLAAVTPPGEFLDPLPRKGEGLMVTTQLHLGAQPQLLIQWEVDDQHWRDGFKLMGFRSTRGFATELQPQDLSTHGDLIIQETADGSRHELLPEGTYFYTFLLRRKGMIRNKVTEPVRFSQEIPSARTALARLKDQRELHAMQLDSELAPAEAEIKRNEVETRLHRSRQAVAKLKQTDDPAEAAVREAVEAIVRKAVVKARTQVELQMQLSILTESLKLHPGWKKLKPAQRQKILRDITETLDGGEATWVP